MNYSQIPARIAPARTDAKHSANASAVSFHRQLRKTTMYPGGSANIIIDY